MRFTIEMQKKVIYYRNVIEKASTIEMHGKCFYYRNALELVLLQESIEKGFTIEIHWVRFLL